jgi:hypothetical protein
MTRYFFDTYDGESFIRDQDGLELSNLRKAEEEAARCLPEMAKDALPNSNRRDFIVSSDEEAPTERWPYVPRRMEHRL